MADEHAGEDAAAGRGREPVAEPATGKATGKPARIDAYHEQFAARMIEALKAERAPWQKPWEPGERISQRNFTTDKSYRGSNAMFLAVTGDQKGYNDPRWGGYRQISEAGGHVRKGEKGTPIVYVAYKDRQLEKDGKGLPRLNEDGHKQYTETQRDRPMIKVHTVFNVEQTEGLKLSPLVTKDAPVWEANKRVEGLVKHGNEKDGPTVVHQEGDRAYYNKELDRVVLPHPSQFSEQTGYSNTALHEIGHATGAEHRLNRPTMVKHEGFGSQSYAREELRAEMAAMMAGEELGVGHKPQHGTAYVGSWIKALENDPKEIRMAAVDAQKAADWMVERARAIEIEHPIEKDAGRRQLTPDEPREHNPAARPLQPEPEIAARETAREAERETVSPSR